MRKRALDLIKRLSPTSAKVKWVEAENLHFTLQFLGEVAVEQTFRVCQALQPILSALPAFEIEVHGAGAFPSPSSPRIVWLGVKNGHDEMTILHDAIGRALDELGFRDEVRRYRPHLTLGRVRGPQGDGELGHLIQANADFLAGTMFVDEVTIFSSCFTSDGPQYEPLAHIELAG